MSSRQEAAETLAIRLLEWLVAQEDLLGLFLGSTGASEADLRAGATDPQFLGAILDFILMDDGWVTRAGQAIEVPLDQIAAARAALPGGEQVHWT